jgi:hypothetical protein
MHPTIVTGTPINPGEPMMTTLRPVLTAALAVAALTLTGCTGNLTSASTPASLIPLPAAVPDLQQAYTAVVGR